MVKRGRFVGAALIAFRCNAPPPEMAVLRRDNKLRPCARGKAIGSGGQAVPTVAFDRNRSVGRILTVSLVSDGSRNGRNPDLSIVKLKGLFLRRFQSSLLLLAALLGNSGCDVSHHLNLIPVFAHNDVSLEVEYVRNEQRTVHSCDIC